MKMWTVAIAVMLSFSGAQAAENNAASCTPIDLRNEAIQGPNETLRQGQRGWCYAFASAVMVSQILGQRVSAFDIAINTNKNNILRKQEELTLAGLLNANSGTVRDAIALRAGKGFCLESKLPWHTMNTSTGWMRDTSSLLETTMNLLNGRDKRNELQQANVFINVIEDVCKARIPFDDYSVQNANYWIQYGQVDKRDAFTLLDEQLAKGQLPVLLANNGLFVWANSGVKRQEPGNHTVNVVGRRFNEKLGECEYILRDSANNETIVQQETPRYENGYLVATKSQISEFLGQIYYLEKNVKPVPSTPATQAVAASDTKLKAFKRLFEVKNGKK